MGWINLFKLTDFKLYANLVAFLALEWKFLLLSAGYCPLGNLCGNVGWILLFYTMTRVLPTMVVIYTLTVLLEFLFMLFRQQKI